MRYLKAVHTTVMKAIFELSDSDPMELCKRCIRRLGLPPFAANPLVLRTLLAHKEAAARVSLDSIFSPFLGEELNA
jgi:hypothetical protein